MPEKAARIKSNFMELWNCAEFRYIVISQIFGPVKLNSNWRTVNKVLSIINIGKKEIKGSVVVFFGLSQFFASFLA